MSFAADIRRYMAKYKRRMDMIAQTATREVFEVAQQPASSGGRMPVVTGRLRDSLTVKGRGGALKGASSHRAVAAGMRAGDVVTGGWSAGYELLAEYGGDGRTGAHFRDSAVDQWPMIVSQAVMKAKGVLP